MLAASGLRKRYGEVTALDGVDPTVAAAAAAAVGESEAFRSP
ncbi:MAG TPA: hypothetical protein VFE55_06400 [Acidimicrobiia bacterium]|nr:hypothetical protein [Acidimicrobiia bacterium]